MIVLVLTAMTAILLKEAPELARQRHWRELAAFLFFWLLAGVLGVHLSLGGEQPNPWKPMALLGRWMLTVLYGGPRVYQ